MEFAEPVLVSWQQARRRWAELLPRIFEVAPLACPRCGGEMPIVAFIIAPAVIDRTLRHARRAVRRGPRARGPPRPGRVRGVGVLA